MSGSVTTMVAANRTTGESTFLCRHVRHYYTHYMHSGQMTMLLCVRNCTITPDVCVQLGATTTSTSACNIITNAYSRNHMHTQGLNITIRLSVLVSIAASDAVAKFRIVSPASYAASTNGSRTVYLRTFRRRFFEIAISRFRIELHCIGQCGKLNSDLIRPEIVCVFTILVSGLQLVSYRKHLRARAFFGSINKVHDVLHKHNLIDVLSYK